jgi:calcium binding protein 39
VGRTALTQQKRIAAEYLEENYQRFFTHYTRQLDSANYATKRQFLKLLSDILLDRCSVQCAQYLNNSNVLYFIFVR